MLAEAKFLIDEVKEYRRTDAALEEPRLTEYKLTSIDYAGAKADLRRLVTPAGLAWLRASPYELKEKVAPFADPSASSTTEGAAVHDAVAAFAQEAIAVLLQLGEPRVRAEELVDRVTRADRTIDTADGLVTAALRLKQVS